MRNLPERRETAVASRGRTGAAAAIAGVSLLLSAGIGSVAAQTVRLEDVVASALENSTLIHREDEHVRRAAGQLQQAKGVSIGRSMRKPDGSGSMSRRCGTDFLTDKIDTPSALETVVGLLIALS